MKFTNRHANPPGFKRLAAGFYVKRLPDGMWLYLFKEDERWAYALRYSFYPARDAFSAESNPLRQSGFPTRAMALSAYERNRVK